MIGNKNKIGNIRTISSWLHLYLINNVFKNSKIKMFN